VLGSGGPDEVAADVRRHVDDLSSDGGFVFAAVHNIQANVPAANILAMHRAVRAARPTTGMERQSR
jgi:uroporphyrinogen decarboxylase